ncbi:MAG TPA: dihydropteroate synthase [Ferruginibacter sp.]|nr:dihydropteroate synthase [Ferruginibacter sp.]
MLTINCKGKILSLDAPVVMGIVNLTPDSFYKGYLDDSFDSIKALIHQMVNDGAAIIDVGGQSTRPGSSRISAKEEIERVLPVVTYIKDHYPSIFISIDTYQSEVANEIIASGAHMVNDISAGNMDARMLATVGRLSVPYICMHMQGTPETMQIQPHYTDLLKEVVEFFNERLAACENAGIIDVILDPGFGFGKTVEHNFWLLKNLSVLQIFEKPILAGLSRKSSIYKTLRLTAGEALNGTTVMHTLALQNGAKILRVHDVKEAMQAIVLTEKYKKTAL